MIKEVKPARTKFQWMRGKVVESVFQGKAAITNGV